MIVLSAAIEIQAPRVALCTILKVNTELRNYLIGKGVTVCEVGYPEESEYEGFYCNMVCVNCVVLK